MATCTMPMYTAASPGNLLPKFSGPAEGGTIARRASLLQATTGAADKSVDAAWKACHLASRARAGEAAAGPAMPRSAPSATITPTRLMTIPFSAGARVAALREIRTVIHLLVSMAGHDEYVVERLLLCSGARG